MMKYVVFLLILCLPAVLHAQVGQLPGGYAGSRLKTTSGPSPSYTGPGDVVSGASHFWGLEAYNAAYATGSNPAFTYSCPGGSPSSGTINILTTGYADAATLAAACGANTITATFSDQIGSTTFDTIHGTVTVVLNCQGTHPCWKVNPSACAYTSGTITQTAPYTLMLSGAITASSSASQRVFGGDSGGSQNLYVNSSQLLGVTGGTSLLSASALSTNTFYSMIGVVNGASGAVSLNGATPTTGNTGSNGFSALGFQLSGNSTSSCSNSIAMEALSWGMWPSALNSTQMGALATQERANWGY